MTEGSQSNVIAEAESAESFSLLNPFSSETITGSNTTTATETATTNANSPAGTIETSQTSTASTNESAAQAPGMLSTLSKKQRKRLLKRDMLQEKKRQRKEDRRAKAIAEGRDLEAEKRLLEERTALGHRKQRLEDIWQNKRMPLAKQSFQIAIDCAFESLMSEREIASLAQQLRYCYSYNKKAMNPCFVAATGLKEGDTTLALLKKEAGFTEWANRLFTCTSQSLEDYYAKENKDNANDDSNQRSKIVYLTSDSDTILERLEDDKIYVIGGIVDRNRLKRVAMDRANALGVATAKFPLDAHLAQMSSTPVLACNHVFDILIKCRQYGNNWPKALEEVLPSRKDAVFHQGTKNDKEGKEEVVKE